ncbi:hypothetical protein Pmani_004143 [Petrolisthes manimaculis]|uniref:Uncharacterized protein n=1 Tax=Petrolisthes manimaculis TaxID=1843537 RepID=A0AAE1QH85_9EUCA|nr:hypothetical protein Pmani_004143 [Petrolisthes manimaculis]
MLSSNTNDHQLPWEDERRVHQFKITRGLESYIPEDVEVFKGQEPSTRYPIYTPPPTTTPAASTTTTPHFTHVRKSRRNCTRIHGDRVAPRPSHHRTSSHHSRHRSPSPSSVFSSSDGSNYNEPSRHYLLWAIDISTRPSLQSHPPPTTNTTINTLAPRSVPLHQLTGRRTLRVKIGSSAPMSRTTSIHSTLHLVETTTPALSALSAPLTPVWRHPKEGTVSMLTPLAPSLAPQVVGLATLSTDEAPPPTPPPLPPYLDTLCGRASPFYQDLGILDLGPYYQDKTL